MLKRISKWIDNDSNILKLLLIMVIINSILFVSDMNYFSFMNLLGWLSAWGLQRNVCKTKE